MAEPAWRDLGVRVSSALILIPIGLMVIWLGGTPWAVWLALVAFGMGAEWAGLGGLRLTSAHAATMLVVLLAAGGVASANAPLAGLAVLVLGACLGALWWRLAWLSCGIVYIGAAYLSLLMLRAGPAGFRNVLFVMLVVWVGDIGPT